MIFMAKIVRKRKKLKLQVIVSMYFSLSICVYLASMTFLRSVNVSLSAKSEAMQVELIQHQEQTAALESEVKQLSSSDSVAKIAEEDGLKAIQSNVKLMAEE